MSSDITFITNEHGKTLRERFAALLESTQAFDCLVGYFYISGFHQIYRSLEGVEKIRILIGLDTDGTVWKLSQDAKGPWYGPSALPLHSHAEVQRKIPQTMLRELEDAAYTAEVETGGRSTRCGRSIWRIRSFRRRSPRNWQRGQNCPPHPVPRLCRQRLHNSR